MPKVTSRRHDKAARAHLPYPPYLPYAALFA